MTTVKYMMSVSVATIVLVGCGASGKLSEREATVPSTTPTVAPVSTPVPTSTPTETPTPTPTEVPIEEANYVIKEKTQRLSSTQQEVLRIHNEKRKNEFSDSDLRYSFELEKVAQEYANKLAKSGEQEHDPDNLKNGYGENLFAHSERLSLSVEDAIEYWYTNEKVMYNYETNECNTSNAINQGINTAKATCGHYTQVVWQDTKEVGCALAPYQDDANGTYSTGSVLICRYQKAGNVVGEKPYCTNYVTNDIYTGTIPTINTKDISDKELEIELVAEDRINCTRTDNRNGSIKFTKDFQSAQLIDFDIFNGTSYTATLDFNRVVIRDNKVEMTGTGLAEEKYPIFMNIEFVGETSDYYGVKLEWNGHNSNEQNLSRSMKAKIYK